MVDFIPQLIFIFECMILIFDILSALLIFSG